MLSHRTIRPSRRGQGTRPRLSLEPLESRVVLSSDCLASISGIPLEDPHCDQELLDADPRAQLQTYEDDTSATFENADEPAAEINFIVTNTYDSGPGSLREALGYANQHAGPQSITFQIPASDPGFVDVDAEDPAGDSSPDVFLIQPLSALPVLNDTSGGTTIDGASQILFGGDTNPQGPEIVVNGALLSAASSGLTSRSNGNQIGGLVIQEFARYGIELHNSSSSNSIASNYIGTNPQGTAPAGNRLGGIAVWGGSENLIGGDTAQAGNLISGNLGHGIYLSSDASEESEGYAVHNSIQGNWINGNDGNGILLSGSGVSSTVVSGNQIGTDQGAQDLGNSLSGVRIRGGAKDSMIGQTDTGPGNRIAFNGADGISIEGTNTTGHTLRGNLVFANADLGIDLGDDGRTPDDQLDLDTGPNHLANSPVLSQVWAGESTRVTGTLSGLQDASYVLEFFSQSESDPTNIQFLGNTELATGPTGTADFDIQLNTDTAVGDRIHATATSAGAQEIGNTSEFSEIAIAEPQIATLSGTVWEDRNQNGTRDPLEAVDTRQTVAIELVSQGVLLATTTTDDTGGFSFEVEQGAYTVRARLTNRDLQTHPRGQFPESTQSSGLDNFLVRAVVAADLNGDGHTDAAYVSEFNRRLVIVSNDGNAQFLSAQEVTLDSRPRDLVAADWDRDGDPDLAVVMFNDSNSPGSVVLFSNDGTGSFRASSTISVERGPVDILASDLDLDDDLDLLVVNSASNTVSVLSNEGAGNFITTATIPVGRQPVAAAAGDVNGDNRPDIVVAEWLGDQVVLLASQPLGGYAAPTTTLSDNGPSDVQLADLDRDGNLDLIASYFGRPTAEGAFLPADRIQIAFGDGSGQFADATRIELPSARRLKNLSVADLDADGDLDLAVLGTENAAIHLLENDGERGFHATSDWDVSTSQGVQALRVAPIDADGNNDLLTVGLGGDLGLALFLRGAYELSVTLGDAVGNLDFGISFTDSTLTSVPLEAPLSAQVASAPELPSPDRFDKNANGVVDPVDVLWVIQSLEAGLVHSTEMVTQLDVNGDGFLSPLDALLIIQQLDQLATVTNGPLATSSAALDRSVAQQDPRRPQAAADPALLETRPPRWLVPQAPPEARDLAIAQVAEENLKSLSDELMLALHDSIRVHDSNLDS